MECKLPDEHIGEDADNCMICLEMRGHGTSDSGTFVSCKDQDCSAIYKRVSDRCVMCNVANAKKWGRAY